jgi:hypothetical protein
MIRARITVRNRAARRHDPWLAAEIADLFQALAKALFDRYRPELHYMRGPGPKWRAKHELPRASGSVATPALVPARASDGSRQLR